MNKFTVVIPYRNEAQALNKLLATLPESLPVIVVDDQSEVPPQIRREKVQCIRTEQRGYFSGAVNCGLQLCTTDVLVLNQDIWFENAKWLSAIEEFQQGEFAIAGDGVFGHPAWPSGYVQGTFMYMSRAAINTIGLLDAKNWPLWGATAEWQARAVRAGFRAKPIKGHNWFGHESRPTGSRFGPSITAALKTEPEKKSLFIRTPPLVSVVIPNYNYGHYLQDAMASLFGGMTCLGPAPGQTFQGFEVIIVDDCSTDNSWSVIQKFVDGWNGVRAFRHKTNCGTATSINTGFKQALGKYCIVLSADDMFAPEALEKLLEPFDTSQKIIVYSDMQVFAKNKRTVRYALSDYDFDVLMFRNMVPATTMMPRAAWEEVGGYPHLFERGREDWAMAIALGLKGYCGVHLPEPYALYRREGQNRSLTNGKDRNVFLGQLKATFPELYRGERPMGCCGSRSKTKPPVLVKKALVPGEDLTMITMEYIGLNTGRTVVYGEYTRTRYVSKGPGSTFLAYEVDVPGLENLYIRKRRAFRRLPTPVAPEEVQIEIAEPVVEKVEPVAEKKEAIVLRPSTKRAPAKKWVPRNDD